MTILDKYDSSKDLKHSLISQSLQKTGLFIKLRNNKNKTKERLILETYQRASKKSISQLTSRTYPTGSSKNFGISFIQS